MTSKAYAVRIDDAVAAASGVCENGANFIINDRSYLKDVCIQAHTCTHS